MRHVTIRPNTVRIFKILRLPPASSIPGQALSLSKGFVHPALRQAQGERGVIEPYCDATRFYGRAHYFTGKTLALERLYGHFRLKSRAHASVFPPGAMRLWLPRSHVMGTIVGWQNASNRHSTRSAKKQKIVSESGAKWFSIVMNASKLCLPPRRADENPLFLFAIKHPETPRNRVQKPVHELFPLHSPFFVRSHLPPRELRPVAICSAPV